MDYPLAARRVGRLALIILAGAVLTAGLALVLAALIVYPTLPSLDALTDYKPKIPLRVYTTDGALIGEFGEERRALVKIKSVPKTMLQAILAAEDDSFYQHGGVDYKGVMRAAWANLQGDRQGASTLTMQVARNFFLTNEKTFSRKFSEVLLALKIERSIPKDQIFELYLNQIYLGQRAYGFAAAAQVYYGKPLEKLTLAETAMLAGLPKAPSRFNPVVNPQRAKERQHYVLRRMLSLNYISPAQFHAAINDKGRVKAAFQEFEVSADYVAEMARQVMFERYAEEAYTRGFRIYTTLKKEDQVAAHRALRLGVMDYDKRHGYRGPEGSIVLPDNADELKAKLDQAFDEVQTVNGLIPAVVLAASPKVVTAYTASGETLEISGPGLQFVQNTLSDKTKTKNKIQRGSLIRVQKDEKGRWEIRQLPQVEAALISLDPNDGAIRALVGGFDFNRNKYNHVIQAWRQPGSSFKPFIYSAALEKGFTSASLINDAPISFGSGEQLWQPKNYDATYAGPMRMRMGLAKSKNMVSIRILQAIGVNYAQDYITRFGFGAAQHPAYLTMALGAGSVTPYQMVSAYSVFANGGYRVKPYFIERILDYRGNLLAQANPVRAGAGAERVIDERNAFIMTSMMQDVIKRGTAMRALQLGRDDLAGKTGTTNDLIDAWFAGYNANLVAVAWIGYDKPRTLGRNETGSQAALPIWINYMAKALKGMPSALRPMPEGVVAAQITGGGLRVGEGGAGLTEYFYAENMPPVQSTWDTDDGLGSESGGAAEEIRDQLF